VTSGESGTLSPLPTPTTTQTAVPGLTSDQAHFTSKGHHSNKTAAIVGGVLGGIAFIALSVGLLLWRQRIKRRKATRAASAIIFANRAVPLQEKVSRRSRDEPSFNVVQDAI
jgi:tellurite resistance protein TehA-like permease